MLRSDLIEKLMEENPHLYQKDVDRLVKVFFCEFTDALAAGDRIEIRGFGAFSTKEHGARMGRNPKNGAPVAIEAKRVVAFRPGKELFQRINDMS